MATLKNLTINDTGYLQIPSGTVAQRPASPSQGMIRYNTDFKENEYYNGTDWITGTGENSIVTNGLVLWLDASLPSSYPGSGTTWTDLSSNNFSGTLTNGPTYSSDNGGSIVFDGTNDVVNGNTSLIDRSNGQEITVSCWIRPGRTSGQYSVFCTNRSNDASLYNWIFYQHINDGAISFHGSAQNKSSFIPATNLWINVTNTVTTSGVSTLYVNGVSIYTVNGYTYGNSNSIGRLGIGADPGGQEPFQGNIAHVSIYNRALTAAEVQQNYNALKLKFGFGVTVTYETLTYTASGNLTVTNNGTNNVSIFKTSGSSAWDNQAYSTTAFTAPCTIEFNKQAGATDNGVSYAMIGWNEDPTTDASYTSLDYASYPFQTNSYYVYHNGSGINTSLTWSTANKFYIVYGTDGFIRHYNGSTLLYSVNYGTGKTVYVDSSFYSVNATYGGFSNIRVSRFAWNGTTYV